MIFYTLLLKIVYSDLIIWLRATSLSQSPIGDYLYEEFCQMDDYAISIEFQNDLSYTIIHEQQIQDNIGQWIKMEVFNQGKIVINEKNLSINITFESIKFNQIKKNYNDYYLEITKDNKYNNFMLQNWKQQYINDLTFDAFISDQDASITLWFKLMIDYDTVNVVSLQNFKEYSFHIIIDILQISKTHLMYFISTNKQKTLRINGMQWNNVIIQLSQDYINLQILTANQIINEDYTHFNMKNIINKEILVQQEGLYIGHLSIQYRDVQFYCSPGCIRCLNSKCQECSHGQYLVDNQCFCQKFYQSQNVDGECKSIIFFQLFQVFPDLYLSDQSALDYHLFSENNCSFGFIYSQGNCYPWQYIEQINSPWIQGNLCSDCIYKPQLNDDLVLHCWQNGQKIRYQLDQYQYISYVKENTYRIINQEVSKQLVLQKNYKQIWIDKQNRNKFKGALVYNGLIRCPYNCAQCQQEQHLNINYCLNLLENQHYSQNIQGLPILNDRMNIFVLTIEVMYRNSILYVHNGRGYNYLESIINNIEINSIILTGVHVIQLKIQLQMQYQVDQVLQDLNTNLYDLNNKINKIKTQHYLNFKIPFIHLLLESNMKYQISIDSYTQIDYIDKLTIQNMHFVSSFRFIKLHASQIIMKNIHFNHTLNNAQILCDHLLIENVIFDDIIDLDVTWFKIYSTSIQFQNVIINNCTLDQVTMFYLTQFDFKKSQLYLVIDQFYVLQSTFISTLILDIQQIDCLMTIENFWMNQTNLLKSNIIYSESKKSKLTLMRNFFIFNSQIYKYLMSEFIKEQINTLSIINCTLNDIYYLFQIAADQNSSIKIRNIILDHIQLIQRVNLFIIESNQDVLISFVLIKNIQIDEQYLYTIFIVKSVSVQLSFIQLRNLEITNFVTINCDQVFVYFINVSDMRVYQLFTIDSNLVIKINKIRLQNLRLFYRLFTLKSQYVTILQNIIFSKFQLNKFETINKFIHLESFALSQALLENLLFIDNYIDNTNFTFTFIEIASKSQIITLSQIYFINNVIKTNLGNLITIQSQYLYINLLLVKNLTIINKQISQVNAFDMNGQIVELKKIKFQHINLVNCHLICQKGVQLSVIRLNLNNITLSNSKLIYITTYDIFLTKIINLNASYLKTDDILIKISSENIEGELKFYYSLMQNIQLGQDIIFISPDLFRIGFYGVKFRNVNSANPFYLINQLSNINNLQILSMFNILVDDSKLGLAKLYGCNYLQIHSSKFTNIQFSEQFIQITNNQLLSLHKTIFQNFRISNIFLNIHQSNKFANKITMEHLLINNVWTSNDEALIIFQNGIEQTLKNIYFINNSCNCPIIRLDNHLNVSRFLVFNSLFSINNVTQIFSFNQSKTNHLKNQSGISQSYVSQQTNYFYINTKFDLPEFFSAQKQLPQIQHIRLNINDFNKLESYVQIEHRVNNVEQNNQKSKYDSFYLPSGQVLNQYKILNLDKLSFKQYIHKFILYSNVDSQLICNLNLIQIDVLDSIKKVLQNYGIKLNQDLSDIIRLQMDPYNRQSRYQIRVDCHDQNLISEIKFGIKPFPCQMGEYYFNLQCNLCNIAYWYNSVKQNQNKCDYFDQSTVSQMKQGLLKLQNGYWRPGYHNKYISKCQIQQNCQGGWKVGDQTCKQGYLGALCSECDIYNSKGDGYYSKIEEKCISCSNGNFKLISYVIIIFFYQLTQTSLAARRSYSYISSKKKLIQQNRFYIILKSLQVDQISICLKILQDIYIKLILINKLQFDIPDIIKIGFNIFPQQLVNEGLYCNISYLGPNILVLELIYIFVFTIILIQISNVIYIILLYRKFIQQSITYITSILQYGYKQSYFYISYLLLSQTIYVQISDELYLIGNQQYTYKYYKHVSIQIILPIFLAYSIIIPLLIILIIIYKKKSNIQQFSKYWAYYIQDYNSKCQFWELYQLIQYSALLFIYFYYYLERNNQLMFFIIAILIDLIIQKNIKIYNIKNLNSIYFETQLKLIALLILFNYYYQLVDSQPLTYIFFGLIQILNYYILKPILSNIIRIIIAKYIHYTIKFQDKLLERYPKLMKYQKKYFLSQNPDRAKQNFQKLIKLFKNNKLGHHKYQKPIVIHHAPYNTSYLELQTSKELEMITL